MIKHLTYEKQMMIKNKITFKSNLLSFSSQIASDDLTSTPPMLATMLDPRHKHLRFLTPPRRIAAHAKLLEVVAEAEAGHGSSTSMPLETSKRWSVQCQLQSRELCFRDVVLMLYSWVKTITPGAPIM